MPEEQKFKKDYIDYKNEIKDYLINQINSSKEIYGLYSLYDIIRDSMLEVIFKNLKEELYKEKIEIIKELDDVIQQKITEFAKKLMS